MSLRRSRTRWARWGTGALVAIMAMAGLLFLTRPFWSEALFEVTGEESLAGQVRGGLEWLGNITRPRPETADLVPVDHAGLNPFGINTFLQEEVEPEKRERAVQMMADAGFHWIRQEFPWEDIEIHGKGDFEDRRHDPHRSAWQKYDNIVDLADRYGMEMIVRLSNPPAWSRAEGDSGGTLAPPDDLNDYGDFVETVVRRYKDRVQYYQIWNEPNIYPEWGENPVSPEEYTELLKVGYTRVKDACPECVVISGALAQTIPLGPRDLNDFIFLQRMYDAGAAEYFDVLAMQGYGLWSGPTDRRMRARVLNFSRPLYLREMMVRNGDADKPIWITEMNWNAAPPDLPDKTFGSVSLEQQARYAVLAYQRAQQEWPWLGVINFWFFKRASDAERDQAMYYFRMAEPDFTPMPVYYAVQEYTRSDDAHRLYPGIHQADHWALAYAGEWETRDDSAAELGSYQHAVSDGATLAFTFGGTDLSFRMGPESGGAFSYVLDDGPEKTIPYAAGEQVKLASRLPRGPHTLAVRATPGPLAVDSITVEQRASLATWLFTGVAVVGIGLLAAMITGFVARRRKWYERGRALR